MQTHVTQQQIVQPQTYVANEPLLLACGQTLANYELVYETYGKLNAQGSNAILICHALTANHHAAGYHSLDDKKPGWWNDFIGSGKPIDTDQFFVVSLNNLGGCHGSTGPISINPETRKCYGPDFPVITVEDWVNSQQKLTQYMGIKKWHAVIGGSLGGMQVLEWSKRYPDKLNHAIIIAAAAKLTAQNIAFNEIARQSIVNDVNFHDGHYLAHDTFPKQGLTLARMIGHVTYLSEEAMREKFDRELRSGQLKYAWHREGKSADGSNIDFQIESYLHYQGTSFSEQFDANSYLLMTKALDYFDPAADYDHDLAACLANTQAKFLLISFTSDWRFSPRRSQEIVNALMKAKKAVSYINIASSKGHDAFLLPIESYIAALKSYLDRTIYEC